MASKKAAPAAGDAPPDAKAKGKGKGKDEPEPEVIPKTPSEIAREEAEYRAVLRKQRFKRRWPEITKVKIKTRPWHPPPPPQRMPPIEIERPELTLRRWVPPYRRRRRKRPRLQRIPKEELTQPMPEVSTLTKIWHSFSQVEKNKMMLQGSIGCNSKRYSSTTCGSQTACIAVVCKALLEEKPTSSLLKRDVDDCIAVGDSFYKRCMVALKCYKGKPQLKLNQLLSSFYLHDTKYTYKLNEIDKGLLAKHPDSPQQTPDLMGLMEKRIGQTYCMILSVGGARHFLVWGHPPTEAAGSVRTIAYIFDPHMLDEYGHPHKLHGAGAFLRYAGITSFVIDFLNHYSDLDPSKKGAPKPTITLTNVEIVQKEPLERIPNYDLDLKALKIHCKSEWESINVNSLIEKKNKGQYPQGSLSAVSLATSRATLKRKVREFYQKTPKEPGPSLPMAPERPPPNPTLDQLMSLRGEDFFLYCPKMDGHAYGRDDMIPMPKSETILHSPVDIADKNFHSQYQQVDAEKWILRGTRHMASYRYQTFKSYTGVACCVVALGMLKRLRARGWNEDTLDETLDLGYNYFRDSLADRPGPIRRLVLGELKETLKIRDQEYGQKLKGIAVWGKINSSNPKVFDLCRGLDAFFKESDSGVLQVPGEFEAAIWYEGDKYYLYHPWPADRFGKLVGLREGGKCCILHFSRIAHMCDHLLASFQDMTRRPFSISDVQVTRRPDIPQPLNSLTPVAPGRWVVRGRFHEGDARFPEEHRNKQATPMTIVALALSQLREADEWTPDDVDNILVKGDVLYQNTMEHLERMGISLEQPKGENDEGGEEEEEGPSGTLAAADVLNKFTLTDFDHVETEVTDSAYNGSLNPEPGSGVLSLEKALQQFFKKNSRGVVTARGASTGVWKSQQYLYMFDPHGCDENGYPSSDPRAGACVIRIAGGVPALAAAVLSNLPAGADDTFNLSPVSISTARIHPELAAPETKLESKAFEWISKGTAAIMMGPRGENTAIGKIAKKAGIGDSDMAGRALALPAAAAFAVATESVPPQYMHQDHMFNFIECGSDYYLKFVKRTGRTELTPEELNDKFTMGANTFTLELGEPIRLPLRLPDEPAGEGEEEASNEKEMGEEEMPEEPMKQIKDALFKMWSDYSRPHAAALLVGDYHQLGVWLSPGGRVVVFDAAPTLAKGRLTPQRIAKGDELRLQRIKDEMAGEGGGGDEEAEDEEAGAEGEEQPEPEPEFVPPESCPALMVFSSPAEFIDKLTLNGGLDRKQCLAPYKLYPVNVINELTAVLKEKKPAAAKTEDEGAADEEEEEALVEPVDDSALGTYLTKVNRTTASVRGRLAEDEPFFLESQRGHQDAANAVMGIAVEHIEPYQYWKPNLIDAVLKYGDRLYTLSIHRAKEPPALAPTEVVREFHATNFNIRLDLDGEEVAGDICAGETGAVLNLKRGIDRFFESNKYGVFCCKNYCVGIWRGSDDKSCVLWEPHGVGPTGRRSPAGAAALCVFSGTDALAEVLGDNVRGEARPGGNRFTITPVKVFWEMSKSAGAVTAQGTVPDEGYEWKVLTAYVETARGRTILRGSRPADLMKFTRDSLLQSAAAAVVAACMAHVRRPHLWTRLTVDEVMGVGCKLFQASLGALGYEFRPGDDVLHPLQVTKRFVLGVNYVRYDIQQVYSGKLEQRTPTEMTCRAALERFFEAHAYGILWSVPHAVAVWRVAGSPPYYMMEPHACGPTGLRIDAQDDGAACVLTFTSAKLMAFAYLQNIPVVERPRHEFHLYAMSVTVTPIRRLGPVDPPLITAPPGVKLVPATSKVGIDGKQRRASEMDRKHPPGSATCMDAQRAVEKRDKEQDKLKGQRNTSGWLVLNDGTQFLSAQHSMACKKFPYASRGNQALSCCVMAVAMSRVQDVCRWCGGTLDQILESGDQLHQDSYLHFRPPHPVLTIHQVLRKFYTPGNCVCRVVVYKARQEGAVDTNLSEKVTEFFQEEKCGVFVAGKGNFAVALFRTPRGYYMFDPADRDRYGRAVAPPCWGKGRACFSQYPNIKTLIEKLGPNIPPVAREVSQKKSDKSIGSRRKSEVKFEDEASVLEPASFSIYGMEVTSLRRMNKHEK